MRTIFIVILFFIYSTANAGSDNSPEEKQSTCRMKGEIFQMAAYSRDHGMSPETALGMASSYLNSGRPELNKEFIKNAINLVYFDEEFINAGGIALKNQVAEYCINDGKPKYQPLK